ncbi:hypothetical protein Nepgr_017041 [Nepenthes gracilis]|uniref:Protein SDA1 n=1 Tax=Nepenthes gracilis TaxID=150966 RepID=A0AAD3SNP6_NEPGR|nr:hypothetical protein Nepgr_017041 [Nepenthes gracilis]
MPSSQGVVADLTPESITASGRTSEKLSLPALQSKMKCDPEGYATELHLLYNQFNSSLELFQQQAALSFNSLSGIGTDPTVAKDLGDRAMFLAHVTPFYPQHLSLFPKQLADLLRSSARSLPSLLRCHVAQALIHLTNRKIVDIGETLALFMELQTIGDRNLRKLAFLHVIHSIRRMNQKHKDQAKNRALQNVLVGMLQLEEESIAKRSLVTVCDLHRRKVWFDDRTANAICMACFHPSSKIMVAALSFLLGYEKIKDDDDNDASSSEDDATPQNPRVVISKEAVYKAHHKGTSASKKKKKAKLLRVMRSMKRQQRVASENSGSNYYSPLNHLKDAQGFAEKLFSHLQSCNERFEVKMMMLKVIARIVGLHRLILLNLYPFLQKYVQPHQRDVTDLLASAVQACHDMVPPDAVEPLFKQIVNQFVHDRSRTEAIAVGLNVVREICLRIPLLMTEELLQDLVLYKKSHEKAVAIAARSLVTLFREVCPSLLAKKDRGRPTDPKARPKAFGEVNVASNVPGIELLRQDDDAVSDDHSDDGDVDNDSGIHGYSFSSSKEDEDDVDGKKEFCSDIDSNVDSGSEVDEVDEDDEEVADEDGSSSAGNEDSASEDSGGDDAVEEGLSDLQESEDSDGGSNRKTKEPKKPSDSDGRGDIITKAQKRKFSDFGGLLNAADNSLRSLKRMAANKMGHASLDPTHEILSDENFQRIRELQAEAEAKSALKRQGLLKKGSDSKSAPIKILSSDQLSVKRVDPAKLEAYVHQKMTKDQRMALVKAGREERGKYQARTAVKQKKKGGLSNKQKEHKKKMPIAAKRAKIVKSHQEKKRKQMRSGKQFRGKKAWN